jgi:FkbM family methyltransferase
LLAAKLGVGRVIAIEPIPETYQSLLANVAANHAVNVDCHNVAVSAQRGQISLSVSLTALPSGTVALTHYLADDRQILITECIALDDLLEDYAHILDAKKLMILIDIEGGEYQALLGMKTIMTTIRPMILIELHPALLESIGESVEATLRLVRSFGYSCWQVSRGGHNLAKPTSASSTPPWIVAVPMEPGGWNAEIQHHFGLVTDHAPSRGAPGARDANL